MGFNGFKQGLAWVNNDTKQSSSENPVVATIALFGSNHLLQRHLSLFKVRHPIISIKNGVFQYKNSHVAL